MPRTGHAAQVANRKPKRGPEALVAAAKEEPKPKRLTPSQEKAKGLRDRALETINAVPEAEHGESCGKTKIQWALEQAKRFEAKAQVAELEGQVEKQGLRESKLASERGMLQWAERKAEESSAHEYRIKYMLMQDLAARVMGGKNTEAWQTLRAMWAEEWPKTKAAALPEEERPEVLKKRLAEEDEQGSGDEEEASDPKKRPRQGEAPARHAAGVAAAKRSQEAAAAPPLREAAEEPPANLNGHMVTLDHMGKEITAHVVRDDGGETVLLEYIHEEFEWNRSDLTGWFVTKMDDDDE